MTASQSAKQPFPCREVEEATSDKTGCDGIEEDGTEEASTEEASAEEAQEARAQESMVQNPDVGRGEVQV